MNYSSSLSIGLAACFQPHSKIQRDLHLSQHKLWSAPQSKLLTLADFCPSFPSHGQDKQDLIGKQFLQTIHPLAALSCPTPAGAVACVSLLTLLFHPPFLSAQPYPGLWGVLEVEEVSV